MEKGLNYHRLLDVIAMLSSKGESGRLQIRVGAARGVFFFKQGKLVDARMGSLTGFPAVNAAVSMGKALFSFDSSISPPTSSFHSLNKRIVLKQLFGIETDDPEGRKDHVTVIEVKSDIKAGRELPPSHLTLPDRNVSDPQNDAPKLSQEQSSC